MDIDKTLTRSLLLLGASHKEVKFLKASYALGAAGVPDIAKKAKLERSTSYLIAGQLLEKGWLEEDFRDYGKQYKAIEPRRLLGQVAAKQRQIRRLELELEESLPGLEALYRESDILPAVRVYQGLSGLLHVWADILTASNEILLWTNQESESKVFTPDLHAKFVRERVAKQIPIRALAVDNLRGRELCRQDAPLLRQTKILPDRVAFAAETYVYDAKLALLDHHKDIVGVIIESQSMAEAQRAIFNSVWQSIN